MGRAAKRENKVRSSSRAQGSRRRGCFGFDLYFEDEKDEPIRGLPWTGQLSGKPRLSLFRVCGPITAPI